MKIHSNISNYLSDQKLTLTLGIFDGVHRGHQSILSLLGYISEKTGEKTGLLTFNPIPKSVFNDDKTLSLISTFDEKVYLLKKYGLDNLFIQEFSPEFRNMNAIEFVENILVKKLNVGTLVIGHDHHFGKNRKGDFALLIELSKKFNFNLHQLSVIKDHKETISSTNIRTDLHNGDIKIANSKLGYTFFMTGLVVQGDKVGRKLGFPTANMSIDPLKIRPKNGVYFVKVKIDDRYYNGMLNIGIRPTFNGHVQSIEVNILDFDKDIYGKNISVYFHQRIRGEVKFPSLDKLISQLNKDKEDTANYFSNNIIKL